MSKQIEYHDKVNTEFAEAVYQEMATTRYGIEFCCTPDLVKWSIKKELLDLNALQVNICPDPNNPAQPGDRNFVPGPCSTLEVDYAESSGNITYVPCGSFRKITKVYPVGDGTDRLCYDSNVEYVVDIISGTGFETAESEIECNGTRDEFISCFVYSAGFPKAGGTLTFTNCDRVEESYTFADDTDPRLTDGSYGPMCVWNNEIVVSAGATTLTTNEICE